MWPHITVDRGAVDAVARAVEVVGGAIEHVFASAVDLPRR